jgi:hypothetical protein
MEPRQSSWNYSYWWGGGYRSQVEQSRESINYKQVAKQSHRRSINHLLDHIIGYQDFISTMLIPNFLTNLNQYNNQVRPIIYRIHFDILTISNQVQHSSYINHLFTNLIRLRHYKISHRIQWRRLFKHRFRVFGTISIKISYHEPYHPVRESNLNNMESHDPIMITEIYRYYD